MRERRHRNHHRIGDTHIIDSWCIPVTGFTDRSWRAVSLWEADNTLTDEGIMHARVTDLSTGQVMCETVVAASSFIYTGNM